MTRAEADLLRALETCEHIIPHLEYSAIVTTDAGHPLGPGHLLGLDMRLAQPTRNLAEFPRYFALAIEGISLLLSPWPLAVDGCVDTLEIRVRLILPGQYAT